MLNRSASERTAYTEMLTAEHFGTFTWVILRAPQIGDVRDMAGLSGVAFFFPKHGKYIDTLNLSKYYALSV